MKNSTRIFLVLSLLSALLTGASRVNFETELASTVNDFAKPGETVIVSPKLGIPMVVRGLKSEPGVAKSFSQSAPVKSQMQPEVVIVGGGTAGLTAALTLSNAGISVLLLERSEKLGGLASGGERAGVEYSNGDAYYSGLIPEQEPIYKQLNLKNYKKVAAIHKPSDSLYAYGKVFDDFWENDETLEELPASFALTKWAHYKLNDQGLIPNQPIEDSNTQFDSMTYTELLDSQFGMLENHVKENASDEKAKKLLDRINHEIKTGKLNPQITADHHGIMDAVIRFYADNYGHSALGGYAKDINAAAGLNFVFSEMSERYTHPLGVGEITNRAIKILKDRAKLVTLVTQADVQKVTPNSKSVDVVYQKDGKQIVVTAAQVLLCIPALKARWMIEDFARLAPSHNQILEKFIERKQLTDYVVTPVFIDGHPKAVRIVYDLWLGRMPGFSIHFPTDFISAEWIKYKAYKEEPAPSARYSAITMYHPLGDKRHKTTTEKLIAMTESDIEFLRGIYNPLQKSAGESDLTIRFAEINFWPSSILRPMVNHFKDVKTLREPIAGRIRLANSNLDTPSHEGAQFRGWRAGLEVARELGKNDQFAVGF